VPESVLRHAARQVAEKSALVAKFWYRKSEKLTARLTFPQVRRNPLTGTGLRSCPFSPYPHNRNTFHHRFDRTGAHFIDGALSQR